jgi:hypothetical protein
MKKKSLQAEFLFTVQIYVLNSMHFRSANWPLIFWRYKYFHGSKSALLKISSWSMYSSRRACSVYSVLMLVAILHRGKQRDSLCKAGRLSEYLHCAEYGFRLGKIKLKWMTSKRSTIVVLSALARQSIGHPPPCVSLSTGCREFPFNCQPRQSQALKRSRV